MMRTTLTIPDDVLAAVKSLALQRRLSLGDAVAELVRRGLNRQPVVSISNAFPCFDHAAGGEPITLERTLELEDE